MTNAIEILQEHRAAVVGDMGMLAVQLQQLADEYRQLEADALALWDAIEILKTEAPAND